MPVINKWDKHSLSSTFSTHKGHRGSSRPQGRLAVPPPSTVSIPARLGPRAAPLQVRTAKPHPGFPDVRALLPADALERVTFILPCAAELGARAPATEHECKSSKRGRTNSIFQPEIRAVSGTVCPCGWLAMQASGTFSQPSRARRGTKPCSRSRRPRRPQSREPVGQGRGPEGSSSPRPAHLVPSGHPAGPDTTRADSSVSAFFSTFQKQTRCLK